MENWLLAKSPSDRARTLRVFSAVYTIGLIAAIVGMVSATPWFVSVFFAFWTVIQ